MPYGTSFTRIIASAVAAGRAPGLLITCATGVVGSFIGSTRRVAPLAVRLFTVSSRARRAAPIV